jgi:hypothetical protein
MESRSARPRRPSASVPWYARSPPRGHGRSRAWSGDRARRPLWRERWSVCRRNPSAEAFGFRGRITQPGRISRILDHGSIDDCRSPPPRSLSATDRVAANHGARTHNCHDRGWAGHGYVDEAERRQLTGCRLVFSPHPSLNEVKHDAAVGPPRIARLNPRAFVMREWPLRDGKLRKAESNDCVSFGRRRFTGRSSRCNASHVRGRCWSHNERRCACPCSVDRARTGGFHGGRSYRDMAHLPGRDSPGAWGACGRMA